MKKIGALIALPVIALASCSKNTETTQVTPTETTPVNNTEVTTNQTSSGEVLNQNISTTTTDTSGVTVKEFKLTYNLPDGKPLNFNGNLEIENGKIKVVNFPEYDLVNGQSYEIQFAKKMQADLVGKELKGLQYDGMSGASLTTKAFNDYLNTINK